MHRQWCTPYVHWRVTQWNGYARKFITIFSYLSSQKVHGVCSGMPDSSCSSIVLTVSSDSTVAFKRSDEVFSFASHSAAAMFETTMQAALQRQKSCDRRHRRHHRSSLKTDDVDRRQKEKHVPFIVCTRQQMSHIMQFGNC